VQVKKAQGSGHRAKSREQGAGGRNPKLGGTEYRAKSSEQEPRQNILSPQPNASWPYARL